MYTRLSFGFWDWMPSWLLSGVLNRSGRYRGFWRPHTWYRVRCFSDIDIETSRKYTKIRMWGGCSRIAVPCWSLRQAFVFVRGRRSRTLSLPRNGNGRCWEIGNRQECMKIHSFTCKDQNLKNFARSQYHRDYANPDLNIIDIKDLFRPHNLNYNYLLTISISSFLWPAPSIPIR